VKIGNVLTISVVDTGACKTVMDAHTAREFNLPIIKAQEGSFGCYSSPGKQATPYYGII
jgi:hypothetical protein